MASDATGAIGVKPLEELAPKYVASRQFTERKWAELNAALEQAIQRRRRFHDVFEYGCSYVTGSVARDEANRHSDLDLFIMDSFAPKLDASGRALLTADGRVQLRALTSIEQAHLLSAIDEARAEVGFRTFSQGGRFLTCHAFDKMVGAIGNAEDDFTNRFTARMLLLLNSRPLVNVAAYGPARDKVVDRYWRQEPDPDKPFYPVFMLNDIRRWWGIVLLNFEYRNPPAIPGDQSTEQRKIRAERRVNNLKLRYARLLASYTPILSLLREAEEDGVRRSSLLPILEATPLERLDRLRSALTGKALSVADDIIAMYDDYLQYMDAAEPELYEKVLDPQWSEVVKARAYHFGDLVGDLLRLLGEGKRLYRYVVI